MDTAINWPSARLNTSLTKRSNWYITVVSQPQTEQLAAAFQPSRPKKRVIEFNTWCCVLHTRWEIITRRNRIIFRNWAKTSHVHVYTRAHAENIDIRRWDIWHIKIRKNSQDYRATAHQDGKTSFGGMKNKP
jgi:hypothetical protein